VFSTCFYTSFLSPDYLSFCTNSLYTCSYSHLPLHTRHLFVEIADQITKFPECLILGSYRFILLVRSGTLARKRTGGTTHLCGRARPSTASLARELVSVTMILSFSASKGTRRSSGDVKVSPCVWRSHSVGSPSSTFASYEWVRDDVLKYKSSITSMESVATLQHQVKLTNLEDACKMVIQACKSDDFPFLRAASGNLPFLSMYRFLFVVLGLVLPLTTFLCALL